MNNLKLTTTQQIDAPKSGELRFYVIPGRGYHKMDIYIRSTQTITAVGGNFTDSEGVDTGSNIMSISSSTDSIYCGDNVQYILFSNKNNIKYLTPIGVKLDIADLRGCQYFERLFAIQDTETLVGNVSNIKYFGADLNVKWKGGAKGCLEDIIGNMLCSSLTFEFSNQKELMGNISIYNSLSYVVNIHLTNCPLITGNIEELVKPFTVIDITGSPLVYGSLEGLAEAQIANGRTSGTLKVSGYNTQITYQGQPIGAVEKTIAFSGSSYSIS
jgi:hypothetical protein